MGLAVDGEEKGCPDAVHDFTKGKQSSFAKR